MRMADGTVQRYSTLDRKVDLLIERMSEFVRLVNEYMEGHKLDGAYHPGDVAVFGGVRRRFPICIAKLEAQQSSLKVLKSILLKAPIQSERATELGHACEMIYMFHNHNWRLTAAPGMREIRNELKNLLRFEKNLYPREGVGGFTRLNMGQGPLIKFVREETGEVVVVSQAVYNTRCVVCLERERDVVLYPCKHCCLCKECKESVHRCPICRGQVRQECYTDDMVREKKPVIMSGDMGRLLAELAALGE